MEISSHVLRISGKAELPNEIEIGHNYHISMSGSVTDFKEADMENGTRSRTYTFKPVKVELLDPLGKTLKLKDPRKMSQLFRQSAWKMWKDSASNIDFDTFYERLVYTSIRELPYLVDSMHE